MIITEAKKVNRKSRARFKKVLVFLVVLLVFGYFFVFSPVNATIKTARSLNADLKYFKDGIVLQNLPQMKNALTAAEKDALSLKNNSRMLVWLSVIPVLNGYYSDLVNGSEAIVHGVRLAGTVLEAATPEAASLGFSPTGAKIPISGQDRIAGLTKVAPLINEQYTEIAAELSQIKQNLDRVDPNRYPESYAGKPIRSLLVSAKSFLNSLGENSTDLQTLLSTLPEALGTTDPKTYLVLFQNDKELRPTGGFWTAYALFRMEKGKIVSIQAGDIYFLDIDNRVPFYPTPPAVIQKYLKLDKWYIRDTNLSPDYRKSVETFNEFWARVPGVPKTDGVIAIDTSFVQGLMTILGDIKIPNYDTFTSENVVYQLELVANVLGSREEKRGGRKDIIGVLMREMMAKAFALPANQYDKILGKVWDLAGKKHLLFYFNNSDVQSLVEKYNLAGRINDFEGDYLHVNDANLAGRKANMYMKENVSKEIKTLGGGKETLSTVTVDYENTGSYNADWNTGYRDYVRVYVPKGSELVSSDGSLETVESGEDLGRTYFAAYMAVNPLQKAKLTLTYRLPAGLIKSGQPYQLLVQKQPGTDGQTYTISVGNKKESFVLDADRIVEIE